MADEEQPLEQEQENDSAAEGGGSKKKILVIAILLVVLIIAGAGAGFFFLSGGSGSEHPEKGVAPAEGPSIEGEEGRAKEEKSTEAKDSKAGEEAGETENPSKEVEAAEDGKDPKGGAKKAKASDDEEEETFGMGRTFTFKPFHLNLGNPLENHYVRLEVSLEYNTPKAEKELERRKAQLRDAIVSIVSNKTREFLINADGKEQLRLELLERINRYMTHKIEQVFITDILIE